MSSDRVLVASHAVGNEEPADFDQLRDQSKELGKSAAAKQSTMLNHFKNMLSKFPIKIATVQIKDFDQIPADYDWGSVLGKFDDYLRTVPTVAKYLYHLGLVSALNVSKVCLLLLEQS